MTDSAIELGRIARLAGIHSVGTFERRDSDVGVAILAHLDSAGRLIPAGGMALTAEQVSWVQALSQADPWWDEEHLTEVQAHVRALFPATEPAEDAVGDPLRAWKGFLKPKPIGWYRTMELDFAAKHFGFPVKPDSGDWFTASDGGKWCSESNEWELRYYPPAPTEPAEEDTKAEALTTFLEGVLDYDSADMGWHLPGDWDPTDLADAIVHASTSSPVVPAPTETGPWPTWQEVPNDTPFWSRDKRETNSWWWIKRTTEHRKELRQADPCGETVHLGPTSFMNEFAPFVAAEEG